MRNRQKNNKKEYKDLKGIYPTGSKTTDTMSIQVSPQKALIDKWNLYCHLPHDKNWDLQSYKKIMTDIDDIEKLIAINESVPENIVKYCMLFVMRNGITPMWEDPKNRNGGCFSFKVINKQVYTIWKSLFYALCGETLCVDPKHNAFVNGITISPKKNFCIIKIWLENCSIQDPSILINIPNLTKQGCLFKKHEPEF
jgi:hypothetical protein